MAFMKCQKEKGKSKRRRVLDRSHPRRPNNKEIAMKQKIHPFKCLPDCIDAAF
jgi:hypothetical protein